MTRIEKAMNECNKMLLQSCPGDFLKNEPLLDEITALSKDNKIIGCRGITCEQCWNAEAKE